MLSVTSRGKDYAFMGFTIQNRLLKKTKTCALVELHYSRKGALLQNCVTSDSTRTGWVKIARADIWKGGDKEQELKYIK